MHPHKPAARSVPVRPVGDGDIARRRRVSISIGYPSDNELPTAYKSDGDISSLKLVEPNM